MIDVHNNPRLSVSEIVRQTDRQTDSPLDNTTDWIDNIWYSLPNPNTDLRWYTDVKSFSQLSQSHWKRNGKKGEILSKVDCVLTIVVNWRENRDDNNLNASHNTLKLLLRSDDKNLNFEWVHHDRVLKSPRMAKSKHSNIQWFASSIHHKSWSRYRFGLNFFALFFLARELQLDNSKAIKSIWYHSKSCV